MNSEWQKELQDLLSALLDEDHLEPAQQTRLRELLEAHPEAREIYLDYFEMHGNLTDGLVPPAQVEKIKIWSWGKYHWAGLGLLALAASLLITVGLYQGILFNSGTGEPIAQNSQPLSQPTEREEAIDETIAVLLTSVGAVWDSGSGKLQPGTTLLPGRLKLVQGLACIQFYSGASVVLEGPADLDLQNAYQVYCYQGRLRAIVPPQAKGFVIESPQMDLVDLGTEFGMQVDQLGQVEVHVFDGKVELHEPGTRHVAPAPRELTDGRAIAVDMEGTEKVIPFNNDAFPAMSELSSRSNAALNELHESWKQYAQTLTKDPRLKHYYNFEPSSSNHRRLVNQAENSDGTYGGAVVGCQWTEGRWPNSTAFEWKRPGDRVRVYVPGEFDELTLMAWVRIDGLDYLYSGLMLTDEFKLEMPHWQIDEQGRIIFCVKASESSYYIRSKPVFGPSNFGQWTHLVVVYDGPGKQMKLFANGQVVAVLPIQDPPKIKIGPATIGNWGISTPGNPAPIRNLNGRMDEFMLFDAALSDEEIQMIYSTGQPNQ
ncbi:LamG-like jellyroll fold domain-containing protein [Blastopirellula marina]|uniref:LamG-like jellyroll fold domain-containing protein n=1 Tax=Blastopirellula marina DSM 3645 TaxID=314230 RepID=A4A0C0_9BACT|nr:LamG-like jellyroll fold domain-containing protein [Blastopirellula marina]EAQ77740.1 hypothetical protein DSM3645_25262 [Blastopirellula marina DSM 3645]